MRLVSAVKLFCWTFAISKFNCVCMSGNERQLSAVSASMKNDVNCETSCYLHESVNHRVFQCKWGPVPGGRLSVWQTKFQRWVSGFVHWWKTLLTAKCSVNCTNQWIIESLNANGVRLLAGDRPSEGRLQIRSWDVMAFVWRVSLNIGGIREVLTFRYCARRIGTILGILILVRTRGNADSHNWHRNALRWLVDGFCYLWTCNVAILRSKLVFIGWDQSQP